MRVARIWRRGKAKVLVKEHKMDALLRQARRMKEADTKAAAVQRAWMVTESARACSYSSKKQVKIKLVM